MSGELQAFGCLAGAIACRMQERFEEVAQNFRNGSSLRGDAKVIVAQLASLRPGPFLTRRRKTTITSRRQREVSGDALKARVLQLLDPARQPIKLSTAPIASIMFASAQLRRVSRAVSVESARFSPISENDIYRVFDSLDRNRNGQLDQWELRAAMRELGLPSSEEYVGLIMDNFDANRDGVIDYAEFRQYVRKSDRRMRRAFQALCGGKEGITEDSIQAALTSHGLPSTSKDTNRMLRLLNADSDSEITYHEFARYMCMLPTELQSHHHLPYVWMDSADWATSAAYNKSVAPKGRQPSILLAGAIAGGISRTVAAPMERIRTLLMTGHSTSFRRAVADMWKDGGLPGLFKGNVATICKIVPNSAIQWLVVDSVKQQIRQIRGVDTLGWWDNFFAGCAAGFSAGVLTYPLETMKTIMAVPGASRGNIVQVVQRHHAAHGLAGFYKGFKSFLLSEMIGLGVGFGFADTMSTTIKKLTGRNATPLERGFMAASSTSLTLLINLPLEVVQRRMQIQGTLGHPVIYKGAWNCFFALLRSEGVTAFYRSYPASVAKIAPMIGVQYMVYDLMRTQLAIDGLRKFGLSEEERDVWKKQQQPDPGAIPTAVVKVRTSLA